MRIGLLTDIHDSVDLLRMALKRLEAERLDVIVQIGDACDLFGPRRDTPVVARLLQEAGVLGVWGNHDMGFCYNVTDEVRSTIDPAVLSYMAGVRPRLELGECHFSHVDPYIDPTDALAIWSTSERPATRELAGRSFAVVPQRWLFVGHYHRWLATSDEGRIEWDGAAPIRLDGDHRYLTVVGPLVSGCFGAFDTDTALLTPFVC